MKYRFGYNGNQVIAMGQDVDIARSAKALIKATNTFVRKNNLTYRLDAIQTEVPLEFFASTYGMALITKKANHISGLGHAFFNFLDQLRLTNPLSWRRVALNSWYDLSDPTKYSTAIDLLNRLDLAHAREPAKVQNGALLFELQFPVNHFAPFGMHTRFPQKRDVSKLDQVLQNFPEIEQISDLYETFLKQN